MAVEAIAGSTLEAMHLNMVCQGRHNTPAWHNGIFERKHEWLSFSCEMKV